MFCLNKMEGRFQKQNVANVANGCPFEASVKLLYAGSIEPNREGGGRDYKIRGVMGALLVAKALNLNRINIGKQLPPPPPLGGNQYCANFPIVHKSKDQMTITCKLRQIFVF